jgi:hypothetical protein
MSLGVIYWDQLNWEAFATLAAGALTVGAAVIIGLRQVGITAKQASISARQTEILGKQAELDELKLRSDLFDRRFKVYEATQALLFHYVRHADPADGETANAFLVEKDRANFLFSQPFWEHLQTIWSAVCHFDATYRTTTHHYQAHGAYGPDLDQHHANQNRLVELTTGLVAFFQTEMSLTTLDPPRENVQQ